jgi:hypothetical protein
MRRTLFGASYGPLPAPPVSPNAATTEWLSTSPARYLWAILIARIYEILPLICPECGGEMRLIACVTGPEPVQRILLPIDEPATPPSVAEAFD